MAAQSIATHNKCGYEGTLTEAGELKVHAGNIIARENYFVIAGGAPNDSYMVVSLPKGYKFTGYSMTIMNNMNDKTYGNLNMGSVTKTFSQHNLQANKLGLLSNTIRIL